MCTNVDTNVGIGDGCQWHTQKVNGVAIEHIKEQEWVCSRDKENITKGDESSYAPA